MKPKLYTIFSAEEAKREGLMPQEGDEYFSVHDGIWKPIPPNDSAFEVEPLNRREAAIVGEQLSDNQQLANDVERLTIQVSQMRIEMDAVKADLNRQDEKSAHFVTRAELQAPPVRVKGNVKPTVPEDWT